jgi:hypothetical protein
MATLSTTYGDGGTIDRFPSRLHVLDDQDVARAAVSAISVLHLVAGIHHWQDRKGHGSMHDLSVSFAGGTQRRL